MFRISLCVITKSDSVPAMFVFLSPCAKFAHSFPHAVVQVYFVTGSLAKVWYFDIVSPETEWTTGVLYQCTCILLPVCLTHCSKIFLMLSGPQSA